MHSAGKGHTEIVVLLLDRGAEVDSTDRVSFFWINSSIPSAINISIVLIFI